MDNPLHDTSRFPFVTLRSEACVRGFAAAWGREMSALLADGRPFVVAFEPATIDEHPDDFRERAIWFKTNRAALAGVCAGMLAIVPGEADRLAAKDDLEKRSRGFGVPYLAVASFDEAAAATASLISTFDSAHRR